jgi:hypothetical protein
MAHHRILERAAKRLFFNPRERDKLRAFTVEENYGAHGI